MTALTFSEAVEITRPKYIEVKGRMIGLRPIALYSLNDTLYQSALLETFYVESKPDGLWEMLWYGIFYKTKEQKNSFHLKSLAKTYVIDQSVPLLDGLSKRHYRRIVLEGQAFVLESIGDKPGKTTTDLGAITGNLQKHYGGDYETWWSIPQFKLKAAADAATDDNKPTTMATGMDFLMSMAELGIEVD